MIEARNKAASSSEGQSLTSQPLRPDVSGKARKLLERALYTGPTVTADQLIGVDSCLRQLRHQIKLLDRPELGERMGLVPSGTLFIGPPGTGKTLVARYLAGQLNIPLYQVSADEFENDPKLVHDLFRLIGNQRAILFIDEVSLLAQKRELARRREMLSALLTSLDGLSAYEAGSRLWVIGATTADLDLDPATYRSGRMGVVIEFAPPAVHQREQLLKLYLAPVPNTLTDDEIARLAHAASRATGADIRDWVNQAAAEALGEDDAEEPVIEFRHLELVVARRGYIAAERPEREPTWEVAVHEAGHAVVAWSLFSADALSAIRATYGPDESLGANVRGHFMLSDKWAAHNMPTSETWRQWVSVRLAGACAEQLVLGSRGQGAGVDLAQATELILGQLDHGDSEFGPSRTSLERAPFGYGVVGAEEMRETVWVLARSRFEQCRMATMAVVTEHEARIRTLAEHLINVKGTLSGDELVRVIEGVGAEHDG